MKTEIASRDLQVAAAIILRMKIETETESKNCKYA